MKRNNYASYHSESIIYSHCSYLRPTDSYFNLHSHPQAELLLFVKGNASYVIEDKIFKLQPHDTILIRPDLHHYLCLDDSAEYERYDIMFDLSILPKSLATRVQSEYKVLSLADSPDALALFSKIDQYINNYAFEDAGVLVTNIVTEILYKLFFESHTAYTGELHLNRVLEDVLQYINAHLCEIKGIDEICNELFISKSYLHKLFRHYMLITPKKYIVQKRLALARQMITSGEKPHKVYAVCGFEDYTTFFRSYKSFFGTSPAKGQFSIDPKSMENLN